MNELKSQILDMVDFIDYQSGSVVSRTISKNTKGNITVFAFDKDQGLSEHTAPFDAFVYIIDGSAEIKISGDSLLAEKGKMIIMPANEPHSLKAVSKFKMLLVMIKGESEEK